MQNALKLLLFSGVFLTACQQQRSDQNIMIDNNVAGADIEALPPDESSATPTDELVNGVDENEARSNEAANSL